MAREELLLRVVTIEAVNTQPDSTSKQIRDITSPRRARDVPVTSPKSHCKTGGSESAAVRVSVAGARRGAHTTVHFTIVAVKPAPVGTTIARIRSRASRSAGRQRCARSHENQDHHGNQHEYLSHRFLLLTDNRSRGPASGSHRHNHNTSLVPPSHAFQYETPPTSICQQILPESSIFRPVTYGRVSMRLCCHAIQLPWQCHGMDGRVSASFAGAPPGG